jgi:hypothetical protein
MKKIYITGHGLMASDGHKDSTMLQHQMHTYCNDNAMLEGGVGSTSIVDTGFYKPQYQSAKNDASNQTFKSAVHIATHYAYGGTSNLKDYNKSEKFNAAKVRVGGLHGDKIQLDKDAGVLFRLNDDEYLYCTAPNTLTALDAIQHEINIKLFKQEYELHWVACRSHIDGDTEEELLAYVRDYGADGENVSRLVTSLGTYTLGKGYV